MGTQTPGKQPSKQLSRQESQQELNSYFAKSNTTELVKMTSTATSERSGRIPDLKTTTLSQAPPQVQHQLELRSLPCWCRSTLSSALCSPPPPPSSWWSHPGGSKVRRLA